ncbi:MAG: hypothetical protein ACKV0T_22975, partial [Planctomycetales bacterium]
QLAELAESSRQFVQDVRESQADQEMLSAATGLGEFSGSRGHASATEAADTLEHFLSRCQGQGKKCEGACDSLKFNPGEGGMGETLSQLLANAGFKPGMGGQKPGQTGEGAGGGFSARTSAMNNMGLYGNLPTKGNPQSSKSGGGKQGPTIGGSFRTDADRPAASRLDPHGMLKAAGASESAVPVRYRRRVEQYFQRIAEETGGSKKP